MIQALPWPGWVLLSADLSKPTLPQQPETVIIATACFYSSSLKAPLVREQVSGEETTHVGQHLGNVACALNMMSPTNPTVRATAAGLARRSQYPQSRCRMFTVFQTEQNESRASSEKVRLQPQLQTL